MIPVAFSPGITESWLILSSHFVAGVKVVSTRGPFDQGSSDLTAWPSPPHDSQVLVSSSYANENPKSNH